MNLVVDIPTSRISDWDTFHDVFAETMGFPAFYGRNMNAWTDCMSYVDDEASGMTKVTVAPGAVLVLQLEDAEAFEARCREQYAGLVECTELVNTRRVESGDSPMLAVSAGGVL